MANHNTSKQQGQKHAAALELQCLQFSTTTNVTPAMPLTAREKIIMILGYGNPVQKTALNGGVQKPSEL